MTEANEKRVFYKVVSDYSALFRDLKKAETGLAKVQALESAYNAKSAKDKAAATKASTARATALGKESKSLKEVLVSLNTYKNRQTAVTVAVRAATAAINSQNRALKTNAARFLEASAAAKEYANSQRAVKRATGLSDDAIRAQKDLAKSQRDTARATEEKTRATDRDTESTNRSHDANVKFVKGVGAVNMKTGEVLRTIDRGEAKVNRFSRAWTFATRQVQRFDGEGNKLPRTLRRIDSPLNNLQRGLEKFGNWRPHFIPPFVALIPIIAAVVAALNPLVALIGALGPLTLGLASQLGSLAGALVALPGLLSGVAAGIAGVIASMGGIGAVFKAYSAMKKATGQGSGESQADRAGKLADAEYNLAKAQRNVKKAQEDLNKARVEALKDLIALRLEVSRASMTEDRAIADLQLARENYLNVMAEPGSTKGDKLDAAASVKEAEANLADVRRQNAQNQKDLTAAEKKGVEQSEKVTQAKENLTDAIHSQTDAQRALKDEQLGGSGAVKAINQYQNALDQLSPSARKVVLAIIAMQDQWKAFRRDLQETLFSQITDKALRDLPQILQNITSFLKPAAKAMGQFADSLLRLLESPEWTRDFKTIGEANGVVVTNLAAAFLSLLGFMKDLTVAAIPFTTWMTEGFRKGADNFSKLLDTKQEQKGLANWLLTVETRLRRWWQVVKNIGVTIFNYSAAASEFGDWLGTGILEMTENWRKASENAKLPGSTFQQWLIDVRPLLREVDGLLGDFFGWFARQSQDTGNISSATNLIKILRDDLGPALGNFLDTLAKTDIDEKFLLALSSIVESVDTILKTGGTSAFSAFFDVLTAFFKILSGTLKAIPAPILEGLLSMFGTLAALTFVAKFTGINFLFKTILGISAGQATGLTGMFSSMAALAGMSALSFGGLIALITAIATLPATLPVLMTAFDGLISGSDIGQVGSDAKDYQRLSNGDALQQARRNSYKGNEGSQQRNFVFDFGRQVQGSDRAWQRVDDELRGLLSKGDEDGFRQAWMQVVSAVPDAPDMWIYAYKTAKKKGWLDKIEGPSGTRTLTDNLQPPNTVNTRLPDGATLGGGTTMFGTPLSNPEAMGLGGAATGTLGQPPAAKNVNPFQWLIDAWKDVERFFNVDVANFFKPFGDGVNRWNADVSRNIKNTWITITTWFDQNVGARFEGAWRKVEKWWNVELPRFWGQVGTNIANIWNGIVANLGLIFAKIQGKFAGPINWVITNVWNNGIVKFWNTIASKLGLGKLSNIGLIAAPKTATNATASMGTSGGGTQVGHYGHYAGGGVLPGYTPGRDVHDFFSPTGGRLKLSGGEAIMRPEFTKAVGGKKGVDAINKKARSGAAFKNGGVFGTGDGFGDIVKSLGDLFTNPVGKVAKGLTDVINSMTSGLPKTAWGQIAKGIPMSLVKGLSGKAASAKGGGSGGGMGWEKQWSIVHKLFPWATLNSALRPGAKTVGGSTSYHALGRAIDVTPSLAIFNYLRNAFPNSKELIYSPAGSRQLQNGRNYFWPEPIRSQHFSHVHWAMKHGGVIPGLYDNGGWLPHGGMAVNQSGKPEAVLDPTESRALKALLAGSGLTGSQALSAVPATSLGNASRIVDNSINIQTVNLVNPVPEKMSVSLPKTIRNLGYMNLARDTASR